MSPYDDEEDEDRRPSSPEPVRSGGFSFGKDGFKFGGIARQSVARIKLSKFTKPWYTAQLKLYGVPFDKKAKATDLLHILEEARRMGKTKVVTNEVVQIEQGLATIYKQKLDVHAKAVDEWRDREFARMPNLHSELCFDSKRFLAKYFLDDQGKPAPSKNPDGVSFEWWGGTENFARFIHVEDVPGLTCQVTPDLAVVYWSTNRDQALDKALESLGVAPPTALSYALEYDALATSEANLDIGRFLSKYFLNSTAPPLDQKKTEAVESIVLGPPFCSRLELRAAAANVPGLQVDEAKDYYKRDYTVVGWGSGVEADLKRITERRQEQEREAIEAERQIAEARAMEKRRREEMKRAPHRQYLETHTQPPQGALKLADLTGTYFLDVTSEHALGYGNAEDECSLSICAPRSSFGCLAAFNIGMVEGTMLLAMSDDDLHAFAQEEKKSETDSEDDYCYGGVDSRKRKAQSQGGQQVAIRRRLGEAPRPGRVCFQWAGREIGEGEMQLDDEGKQIGYIDFDPSGYTGKGVMKYPSFFGDKGIEFSIYKTLDTPSAKPEPWSDFTDEQYEYERKARWGRW